MTASTAALVTSPAPDTVSTSALATTPATATPTATALTPRDVSTKLIVDATNALQSFITALPVDQFIKTSLEGTLWTVRRTFFNLAPTVNPVQVTGVTGGLISGKLDAVDPEGDAMTYRLVHGPAAGIVQVSPDGTFTYIPADGFTGVDTFEVAAADQGLHLNLLDLFRPNETQAQALLNQNAIRFSFTYEDDAAGTPKYTYWTAERRAALVASAPEITTYFRVTTPVTLTYLVSSIGGSGLVSSTPESEKKAPLAAAGSNLVSQAPGFWNTVVQQKLLTGQDANGANSDGVIEWNWVDYQWALGNTVDADEYDFKDTLEHELLHSFGFLSIIWPTNLNSNRAWSIYDSFLVTVDGTPVVDPKTFAWKPAYDSTLTGGENGKGLFFDGLNATAAYDGATVPLYTPSPYENGSSVSHLADYVFDEKTGLNQLQVMNSATVPGKGVRVLSNIELGILKDIGYNVVPFTNPAITSTTPIAV